MADNWQLGDLADPGKFQAPILVKGQDPDNLKKMLESMMLIRHAERQLAAGRRDELIGGPVHLGVGQEAVAVGIAASLRKSDRVFGAHRSHSHVLSQGADLRKLFAEVLGKATGLSRGMGGSMHLFDKQNGFHGSVPIVAGTVPLAVGAGLAAKLQDTTDIGVAYIGDGALEEGIVHESLNLSKSLKAQVLFVVENNLFASHMHISQRQPSDTTSRFAAANLIPFEVVDGNDILAVQAAAASLIEKIRAGDGPGFIEAVTYRWYGHVDWREDIDVGVNRSSTDVAAWRKRDPIARLVSSMLSESMLDDIELDALEKQIQQQVIVAWDMAMDDPYPAVETLLDNVYSVVEQTA